MLEIGILFLAGVLFLATAVMMVVMLKEFSHMKVASILMETAFKEQRDGVENMQEFMQNGLKGAEAQYATVIDDYAKVINSNHGLQERINKMEASQKKPLAPDVTYN